MELGNALLIASNFFILYLIQSRLRETLIHFPTISLRLPTPPPLLQLMSPLLFLHPVSVPPAPLQGPLVSSVNLICSYPPSSSSTFVSLILSFYPPFSLCCPLSPLLPFPDLSVILSLSAEVLPSTCLLSCLKRSCFE